MTLNFPRFVMLIPWLLSCLIGHAGNVVIKDHPKEKLITFGNSSLMVTLDYDGKCTVKELTVCGRQVFFPKSVLPQAPFPP